ncbi:hypothetical protein TSUD_86820 [Trifolium subterraneum]|uniref:Reverse transcriptase zinc-binding domain-containing protein n=1 Tax=Trifolium subterraneum TaxID=3900 RepID=A0A2Z6NPX8_TRISU|nr:hypothetical protein TSUD_86820 [Trifolium subterraneum]
MVGGVGKKDKMMVKAEILLGQEEEFGGSQNSTSNLHTIKGGGASDSSQILSSCIFLHSYKVPIPGTSLPSACSTTSNSNFEPQSRNSEHHTVGALCSSSNRFRTGNKPDNSCSSVRTVLCCISLNSSDIRNCNKRFLEVYELDKANKVWQEATELGVKGDEEEERTTKRRRLSSLIKKDVEWVAKTSNGLSGGLLSVWNEDLFSFRFSFSGDGYLGVCVECEWCLGGDFNSITKVGERRGSSVKGGQGERFEFTQFIDALEVVDIPLKGKMYTWFNADGSAMSKFDRFLVSENFIEKGSLSYEWVGDHDILDHCPIWLMSSNLKWGKKAFIIKEKLKRLKEALKVWNREVFGIIELKIDMTVKELNGGYRLNNNIHFQILQFADDTILMGEEVIHFKFLGLPVGANPIRRETWKPVIDVMHKRLNSWSSRQLSYDGRITLINSLVRIQRNVLWGGRIDNKKVCWVKWDQICLSKEREGLGVKNLELFILALLSKWKWRDTNLTGTKHSIWWKDVLCIGRGWEVDWFRLNIGCRVGNGHDIGFWKFKWFGNHTFKELFPSLFAKESHQDVMIAERLNENGFNFVWADQLTMYEEQQLGDLKDLLIGFNLTPNSHDGWRWALGSAGMFSVKSCYNWLLDYRHDEMLNSTVVDALKQLWKNDVPTKVSVFGWRLLLDKLPTRMTLNHRGVWEEIFTWLGKRLSTAVGH